MQVTPLMPLQSPRILEIVDMESKRWILGVKTTPGRCNTLGETQHLWQPW